MDDKKRLLGIVNASNPSIRKVARPQQFQLQGSTFNPQTQGGVVTGMTSIKNPAKPNQVRFVKPDGQTQDVKTPVKLGMSPESLKMAQEAKRRRTDPRTFTGFSMDEGKNKTIFGWNAAALLPKQYEKKYGVTVGRQFQTTEQGFLQSFDKLNDEFRNVYVNGLIKKANEGDRVAKETLGFIKDSGRLKGDFLDFVEGSNDKLFGGISRGLARGTDFILPGVNTFGLEKFADDFDPTVQGTNQVTQYGKAGETAGTIQKGIVDAASLIIPAAATEKAIRGVPMLSRIAEGSRLGRLGVGAIANVGGGLPASGIEVLQSAGRGDEIDVGKSFAIGAGADLVSPVVFTPVSKLFGKMFRSIDNVAGREVARQSDDILEYLVRENNPSAIKTVLSQTDIPSSNVDEIADFIAKTNDQKTIQNLVESLSVNPDLKLNEAIRKRLQEDGVKRVEKDGTIIYEAQYQDNVITARGQKELDDHVYEELGHHIWDTKLTPAERALFDGSGEAAQAAAGREGYNQAMLNSEDFADYFEKAMKGQFDQVPDQYKTLIRKYAKIADDIAATDGIPVGALTPDQARRLDEIGKSTFAGELSPDMRIKISDLMARDAVTPVTPGTVRVYQVGDNTDFVAKDIDTIAKQFNSTIGDQDIKIIDVRPEDIIDVQGKEGVARISDEVADVYNGTSVTTIDNLSDDAVDAIDNQPSRVLGGSNKVSTPEQQVAKEVSEAAGKKTKIRGAQKSLAADSGVPISIWEKVTGYTPTTNKATIEAAEKRVKKSAGDVYDRLLNNGVNSNDDVADLQVLFRDLIDQDRFKEAEQLARLYAEAGTDAGRTVQQFAALRKTTPTGALFEANKVIREANERWAGKGAQYSLTPEKKKIITELAENVQRYEPGTRERQIAEALLAKEVTRVVPASIGEKLATAQVYAQLLNAKTAIRNIGGNSILAGGETISTGFATPIDYLLSFSKKSQGRTVSVPRLTKKFGGFLTGGKQGLEDVSLGIRTVGESGQFDIKNEVFQNKVGKALDKLLGWELQVPDKAFYMAQFEETLDSVMRAQGVSKPTNEMIQIANEEALYATFQNNSALAGVLSKTKRALNLGKKFGVGELVLKYPKTPGNIVSVGMDYSPYGFMKGMWQFAKETEQLSIAQQREIARNIGRSITGSGLILGGYYLAKNGVLTANPSTDKDVRSLERGESVGQYSINLSALQRLMKGEDTTTQEGDIISNYDWAQPTAIALSMGASMADANAEAEDGLRAAIASASAGIDTITQQPVISQASRFIDKATTPVDRGGGLPAAVADVAAGAPSSFVPSALRQTTQVIDPYVRQTYDPNPVKQAINRAKVGIPGLSDDLPRYKNSFGDDIERYEGNIGKRIFDSFINPAFVGEVARTPEGQMVLDIYESTGETKQFPRVADKKYKINGENRQLTAEEYTKYQEYIGTKTREAFEVLANNPGFMSLPDEEKAETMSKLISDIGQAGKIEVLGAEYKSIPNDVKKILNDNVGSFTNKVPDGVDGNVKAHFEEVAFMDDDTYDAWLVGEPSATSRALITELNNQLPDGINKIGDSNKIAEIYAGFAEQQAKGDWTEIEQIKKEKELWKEIVKTSHSDVANEIYGIASSSNNALREYIAQGLIEQSDLDAAIELDNTLYRSGLNRTMTFNKKFRNEYGYAIPEVVESVKSTRGSSGSGGSGKAKKTKANVGAFRLNFNTNVKTSAPDISRVPTGVRFKVSTPKASNVTPVQLKL